jgi:hypothetical protein
VVTCNLSRLNHDECNSVCTSAPFVFPLSFFASLLLTTTGVSAVTLKILLWCFPFPFFLLVSLNYFTTLSQSRIVIVCCSSVKARLSLWFPYKSGSLSHLAFLFFVVVLL